MATTPTTTHNFAPGTYVQIRGLVGARQYNGKIGLVQSPLDPATGRCGVQLLTPCKQLGVRPGNLTAVGAGVPEPPPVVEVDDDAGDAGFDAVQDYVFKACQAHDRGDAGEELVRYEWMLRKGHQQPSASFNLFLRYSSDDGPFRDCDRAFDLLVDTVDILVSPTVALPSPGAGLPAPDTASRIVTDYGSFVSILVVQGTRFVLDHRCADRRVGADNHSQRDPAPEARAIKGLYFLTVTHGIDAATVSHKERSEHLRVLGYLYLIMGDHQQGREVLLQSDAEAEAHFEASGGAAGVYRHNYESLFLRLDAMRYEVQAQADFHAVVAEANRIQRLMEEEQHPRAYRSTLKSSEIVFEGFEPDLQQLDTLREAIDEGREEALRFGDRVYTALADRLIEKCNKAREQL